MSLPSQGKHDGALVEQIQQIIDGSLNTNSPFFLTQMYGGVQFHALLGDMITSILNTSMYTYEVAPLLTMVEKECIDQLCRHIWSEASLGDGVFTPGGSISNMQAMVLARNAKFPESQKTGIGRLPRFRCYVSDQAHYSFLKGARFLGFGSEAVCIVNTDREGRMCPISLGEAIEKDLQNNIVPLMLVGVSGTTATGVYDDLTTLSSIADQYDMWFHVDAVYGGSLLFSDDQAWRMKGIEQADSVSWNQHKIMGIPLVCAALLTKQHGHLRKAFTISADYLFHTDDHEYDLGRKSIQCGRRVDALKLWFAWQAQGTAGFEKRVNQLVGLANQLAEKISRNKPLELFCPPESPIVCFRYRDIENSGLNWNTVNEKIRDEIFHEGKMLFNFTTIGDQVYLRVVITNPEMTDEHQSLLVHNVIKVGDRLMREQLAASVSLAQ